MKRARICRKGLVLWMTALLGSAAACPAAAAESFKFKSETKVAPYGVTIGGELTFPSGPGPFPVIVFMHPCGGLERYAQRAMQEDAQVMRRAGFAALILDSFGPRNLAGGKACAGGELSRQLVGVGTDDAFDAMRELRKHPMVDKDNVFLVGRSYSAVVALRAAVVPSDDLRFRAIAAYYPHCGPLQRGSKLHSPVVVLAAQKDDWTPASTCTDAKSMDRPAGAAFDLIVYPNAAHAFDQRRDAPVKFKGHTLAYDAQARADGQKRVREFFLGHLTDRAKAALPAAPR